jgi:hypothetical protein
VLQCIQASDHAARAVTKHKEGLPWVSSLDNGGDRFNIPDVVFKRLHIKAFAVGVSASAEVNGVYCEAIGRELLPYPAVITAVCVEARNDNYCSPGLALRAPRSKENL